MMYLGNAFTLNMITPPCWAMIIGVEPRDVPVDVVSVVGHGATAEVFSALLGREVKTNRQAISLAEGDVLYVGSLYEGDKPFRAPEGKVLSAEELGLLSIRFVRVEIKVLT